MTTPVGTTIEVQKLRALQAYFNTMGQEFAALDMVDGNVDENNLPEEFEMAEHVDQLIDRVIEGDLSPAAALEHATLKYGAFAVETACYMARIS